jgi:CRISPR/Cas system-associated exonuclease Cas4 (RecB family)
MKEQKLSVRGSQATFCENGVVLTKYGTGCYRRQLIGSFGIEEPFPEEIAKVGAMNEEAYEAAFIKRGEEYQREVEVKRPILEGVIFSGRMDFYVPNSDVRIRELKSATSENTYKEVIKKGKYKVENLAQVTAYMICLEESQGLLVYTYYPKEDAKTILVETREFLVQIEDTGIILVDGRSSGFRVEDQLEHRYNSARWLVDGAVPPAPKGRDDKYKSPCKWCAFKQACNEYEMGLLRDREQFLITAENTMQRSK